MLNYQKLLRLGDEILQMVQSLVTESFLRHPDDRYQTLG